MGRKTISAAAAWLLGVSLAACGAGGSRSGASTHTVPRSSSVSAVLPQPEPRADADLDSDTYPGTPDEDNNHVYGRPATPAEARAVDAVVRHYYAAAAAGEGARVCALLYLPLAESLAEDYGRPGAPRSGADACGATVPKVLATSRRQLRESSSLKVAAVRIRRRFASARFGFAGGPARYYVLLHLERGAWRLDEPIGTEKAIYVE